MELDTKVPGFLNAEKGVENMGKALKLLARAIMGMDAETIAKIIEADASMSRGRWDESKHPRGKGGKFTSKGSGGGGGGEEKAGKSGKSGEGAGSALTPSIKAPKLKESPSKENAYRKAELAEERSSPTRVSEKAKTIAGKVKQQLKNMRTANSDAAKSCLEKAKKWPKGSEEREIYERYADSMSKPQPGRPTKEESKAMTKKFLGNISSQLKPAAVDRYKKDLANEPAITKDMCDIADALGTEMYGLNYRLKKASDSSDGGCRIADKIAENMSKTKPDGSKKTYEEAVSELSDMVRYTQGCTPETLTDQFEKTSKMLEKKGYKPVKVKNSWDKYSIDRPYRGVNCVFESPTGTKFELQFHTPDSLVGKEVQHPQYEEQRKPTTSKARFAELGKIMYDNMASLKRPKGVERIKEYP